MSRFQRRDREAVISRLDRLLWVMESVATGGWSKSPVGRRSPNPATGSAGDAQVLRWFEKLMARIDDLVEDYLEKLDIREEKLVGTTNEIQSALRAHDSRDKCPACGASTKSAGRF